MASDEQIHNGDENLMTYTYEKTRRFQVKAGTRCAHVQLKLYDYSEPGMARASRSTVQALAMDIAVRLWETRWGQPLPWDLVSVMVSHTTIQVCVELRVDE